MFHGSYRPTDVEFLLKPITIEFMEDLAKKEALIQAGKRHYSEMLSPERVPSAAYLELFHSAHQTNRERLAKDCLRLANALVARHGTDVTIVSLARAGTPVGVILRHLVEHAFGGRPTHFSVSIIRDRGIDTVALREILSRGHPDRSIAFVDGWTGKGVITRELAAAIERFNAANATHLDAGLHVLADLAGTAAFAASADDYLIASSILNATVSGLVSRSILNDAIGPNDYHGCVFFSEFEAQDLSTWFVDDVVSAAIELHTSHGLPAAEPVCAGTLARISNDYMARTRARFGITDANLVKPGIGEATRVLLRRYPERVIVRDPDDDRVAHLLRLASEKNVMVTVDADLPYNAVSLIRSALDA